MLNKYKDPTDNEQEQTYVTWPNPSSKEDGWATNKYDNLDRAQAHFDAAIYLRDYEGYDLTHLLGDFMEALEEYERSGDDSKLIEMLDELAGTGQ